MFLNEYLFLKGRNLAFQTVVPLDGQDGNDISHKFLGAFEVIAFHTFLDYENFYLKGRKTFFFELFDIESNEIAKTLFSEKAVTMRFCLSFLDWEQFQPLGK